MYSPAIEDEDEPHTFQLYSPARPPKRKRKRGLFGFMSKNEGGVLESLGIIPSAGSPDEGTEVPALPRRRKRRGFFNSRGSDETDPLSGVRTQSRWAAFSSPSDDFDMPLEDPTRSSALSTLRSAETTWESIERSKNQLGRGATGQVYRGSYCGAPVAIKILALQRTVAASTGEMIYSSEEAEREIALARRMVHPHIATMFAYIRDAHQRALVMELGIYGDLEDFLLMKICRDSVAPSLYQRLEWMKAVASAVEYLHTEHDLVHRDLKLANVVVCADYVAKLCDFGLSQGQHEHVQGLADAGGTKGYRAPEIMLRRLSAGCPADVFALSIISFQVLTLLVRNPYALSPVMKAFSLAKSRQTVLQYRGAEAAARTEDPPFGFPPEVPSNITNYLPHLVYLNQQSIAPSLDICIKVAQDSSLRPVFPPSDLWNDDTCPLWEVREIIEAGWLEDARARPSSRDLRVAFGRALIRLRDEMSLEEQVRALGQAFEEDIAIDSTDGMVMMVPTSTTSSSSPPLPPPSQHEDIAEIDLEGIGGEEEELPPIFVRRGSAAIREIYDREIRDIVSDGEDDSCSEDEVEEQQMGSVGGGGGELKPFLDDEEALDSIESDLLALEAAAGLLPSSRLPKPVPVVAAPDTRVDDARARRKASRRSEWESSLVQINQRLGRRRKKQTEPEPQPEPEPEPVPEPIDSPPNFEFYILTVGDVTKERMVEAISDQLDQYDDLHPELVEDRKLTVVVRREEAGGWQPGDHELPPDDVDERFHLTLLGPRAFAQREPEPVARAPRSSPRANMKLSLKSSMSKFDAILNKRNSAHPPSDDEYSDSDDDFFS